MIPMEMISVLAEYSRKTHWKIRTPNVGLYADLEVKLLGNPLFVGKTYGLEREIVALYDDVAH